MIELTLICVVFLGAGFIKGITGIGLPTISVAILTSWVGLDQAIAISLLPSLASNLWQAIDGRSLLKLGQRLWPFYLASISTVWLGTIVLSSVNLSILSGILGFALAIYSVSSLTGSKTSVRSDTERWMGPCMGLANGVLTGMTGSYVVPGVMYLQSIDLSREELVQAMGILFTLSTLTLVIALGGTGLISPSNATTSFFALIPVILGMITGQKMRAYLKESSFRNATMLLLLSIGIYLIAGAFN